MNKRFNINHLLSFDEAGNVKPLTTEQLLDNDVREFYQSYYLNDKLDQYRRECGLIFYMGDPNSPPMQEGLSDKECFERAKQEFKLPSMYKIPEHVQKLIDRYRKSEMTILHEAALSLEKSVHVCMVISDKYREVLQNKLHALSNSGDIETIAVIGQVAGLIQQLNKEVKDFPKLVEILKSAKEAIFADMEDTQLRGGVIMTESMNANQAVK
jgi:hypothetical protein